MSDRHNLLALGAAQRDNAPFAPALLDSLRGGYGWAGVRADASAGLTVAIVAIPLSMAIAVASGGTPAQGLITAAIGGGLVSALGGSRFQIGGPAGAFIVLVAATAQAHGMAGLHLAIILAGLMLLAAGVLRIGGYVRLVPYPVVVGFTGGIALLIFSSQIKDFLGLTLTSPEPGPVLEKAPALWSALPTLNSASLAMGAGVIAVILLLRRLAPRLPGLLIAVAGAAAVAAVLGAPVETVGDRFGEMARTLPMPQAPQFSWALLVAVTPSALGLAILGAIESLLSATVADAMTGDRHRSNTELTAQGIANLACALFGGLMVTGTIARTATNVRARAHGPVAGLVHALIILAFLAAGAPLAGYIPLTALAAVLIVVAWNMAERHAIAHLTRASRGDALVVWATLLLTVFADLVEAIVIGIALSSILLMARLASEAGVSPPSAGDVSEDATPAPGDPDVVVYRVRGPLFFGAAASIGSLLERIGERRARLVIDLSDVTLVDSTGAYMLKGLAQSLKRRGAQLHLAGARPTIKAELRRQGVMEPDFVWIAEPVTPSA